MATTVDLGKVVGPQGPKGEKGDPGDITGVTLTPNRILQTNGGGKIDVSGITVEQLTKIVSKLSPMLSDHMLFRGQFKPSSAEKKYQYQSIPNLNDWQRIEFVCAIGDAHVVPIQVDRILFGDVAVINLSGYFSEAYFGQGRVSVEFAANRIGMYCNNQVGWDHSLVPKITNVRGLILR